MIKLSGLEGKHVLVTGAAGLIGSGVCNALAANGAKTTLLDTDIDSAKVLCQNILNQGMAESWCAPQTDLLDEGSIRRLLDAAEVKFGPIDSLIHAAYPRTSDWHLTLEKIPLESWRKNVDMHLNGTFALVQGLGQRMAARNAGSIVLFSSIYGLVGPDFSVYDGLGEMTMPAAYSAIKGGISNFARYLASYWGKNNVRCNCICPGGVRNNQDARFIAAYSNKTPMQRMAEVEDIVGPTLFLSSDLSNYINGVNLPVDGGWTAI